jgi:hypothetical protein
MRHPEPYTHSDPCAETELDIAACIVMGYSDDEIAGHMADWLAVEDTKYYVHDAWWTVVHNDMTDEEMDATFERIWADGSIIKFVLPQVLSRDGSLWDRYMDYRTDIEVAILEYGDDDYTGYGDD